MVSNTCEICKNNGFIKMNRKCKFCKKIYKAEYYIKNKIRLLKKQHEYYLSHIEEKHLYNEQHKKEKAEYNKDYRIKNKIKLNAQNAKYYQDHLEQEKAKGIRYYLDHREKSIEGATKRNKLRKENMTEIDIQNEKLYQKQYKQEHKIERSRNHQERWLSDPKYKITNIISSSIRGALKMNNSSKNGQSYINNVNFTTNDIYNYIENLFSHPNNLTPDGKIWMTWNNWGVYNPKTWNDNDPSTWTWNIDHIIPISSFKYTSMEDEEFKKCWALENLRPLSSKLNILNGSKLLKRKTQSGKTNI